MRKRSFAELVVVIAGLLLFLPSLLIPHMLYGQSAQGPGAPPPVGAQLVREGDFAAALDAALGVGTGQNEIEAENHLANLGILPRNGWMADYPVTPDVLGELQEAVANAADSRKLPMNTDEAIRRFGGVAYGAGLQESPYAGNVAYGSEPATADGYVDQGAVSGYYADQGPPVVTYYAPPPDYYDLYSFVPYPFWYSTFWFPGFFVLRDFHKYCGHGFVSNHFVNATTNRFARVNPVARVNGGTLAGTNAFRAGGFVRTTAPRNVAPGGLAANNTRTISSSNLQRTIAPRGAYARAGAPVATAPGIAIRSFGTPRTTMFSSSRVSGSPRDSMAGGGVRAAPSFGGYHGSSIGGSSFRSSGGGFRSGVGHGGGGHR